MSTTDRPVRAAPQGSATTTRSAPQLKETLGLGQHHAGAAAREDRGQHGRRRGHQPAVAARGRRRATSTSITGQKPSSPRPRSRSPASSSARATPSAPRSRCGAIACGSSSTGSSAWRSPASATSAACPQSFDGRGNYTFGVTEQLIFPEIDYDKIDATRGMDITIVTTARTDAEGKALLDAFGFPFRSVRDRVDGQEGARREAAAQAQVQGARLHPLPALRPAAAVYRKFGLCRICLRELVHAGEIPGVTKASW